MFGNILSKFTSPKVKADKFVQTFANVTSENKNVRQQVVREAFKEKEVEADFSTLFQAPKKIPGPPPPPPQPDFVPEDYFKNVFDPFSKRIKEELGKHQREIRVNINPRINICTILIIFKGREEYQYILQVKPGKTEQTSRVIVKESGARGGDDERATLTGLSVDKVTLNSLLTDFLAGYKRHISRMGWG